MFWAMMALARCCCAAAAGARPRRRRKRRNSRRSKLGDGATTEKGERFSYLKSIAQPVLIINGHDDIMVPTVNSFILQQNLPNGWLILYRDQAMARSFNIRLRSLRKPGCSCTRRSPQPGRV